MGAILRALLCGWYYAAVLSNGIPHYFEVQPCTSLKCDCTLFEDSDHLPTTKTSKRN